MLALADEAVAMSAPLLERAESPARRSRLGRVIVAILVVGMVSMWGYIVYLAFGPGRQPSPDRVHDPAFAVAAEARCRAALAEVGKLPPASASPTAAARADVIEQANGYFDAMLDGLARIAPSGDDGRIAREWIADWRTYLGDRAAYAVALRTDPKADLLVSAKDHSQITDYIDAFAGDNRMPACATPLDV